MAQLHFLNRGDPSKPVLIFVHGLGGHPFETWRHESLTQKDFWPHWVGSDTSCDTWTLGYDASISAWNADAMPLPDQGDQVADLLATEPRLKARRLVLIGHSMGGLVIKTILIQGRTKGDKRIRELVDRVCAVVFVATPHSGSQLASLARSLQLMLRTNDQVGNMSRHDPHLRQLNQQFLEEQQQRKLFVRVFAERSDVALHVKLFGLRVKTISIRVVDPSSSDPGLPGVTAVPMAGDHFSICKPATRESHIHKSICDFIATLNQPNTNKVQKDTFNQSTDSSFPTSITIDPSLLENEPESGRIANANDNRLQPRNNRIYGREGEIQQILNLLGEGRDGDGAPTAIVVAGVGGTGKTEVCKAAIRSWIQKRPDKVVYFVDIPDHAGVAELVSSLSAAIGSPKISSVIELVRRVSPGLYYLDNIESVAEQKSGIDCLQRLCQRPGVRLLISSRFSLQNTFPSKVIVNELPHDAAIRLFRELWSGNDSLPEDTTLGNFVVGQLGAHALSVSLCARLGDCYPFAEVEHRWRTAGAEVARDPLDASRLGGLNISLRLTADALRNKPGALDLWATCALFSPGIANDLLIKIERTACWNEARNWLVRHHVITRRNDQWQMLPPVARYALDASIKLDSGFNWSRCRPALHSIFESVAAVAESVASTEQALSARRWLLQQFGTLVRLFQQEMSAVDTPLEWLKLMHTRLENQYQFRAAQARELLIGLAIKLDTSPSILQSLGDLEIRLGHLDEANGLYTRAFGIYELDGNLVGMANILHAQGNLQGVRNQRKAARELFNRALAIYEQSGAPLGQANALKAIGDLERGTSSLSARDFYNRALLLYEHERSGLGQANVLKAIGDLDFRTDRLDSAKALFGSALNLYELEHDNLGQANTLKSLGLLHIRLGYLNEALVYLKSGLDLYDLERDYEGVNTVSYALSDLDALMSKPANLEPEPRSTGFADTIPSHSAMLNKEKTREASLLYQSIVEAIEREHSTAAQVSTFQKFSDLGASLLQVSVGAGSSMDLLVQYENAQGPTEQANILQLVGDKLCSLGVMLEAAEIYQRALSIYTRGNDKTRLARTFGKLARTLHALKNERERDYALEQALSFAQLSGIGKIQQEVDEVLVEVTGNERQAKQWRENRHRA